MNTQTAFPTARLLGLLLALIVPGAFYLTTLQTIPNGSSQYYMIDVGETQIVLNTWGTLHATGYPHYVLLGSALTSGLKLLGADAATAPALVSLMWGLLALALFYLLVEHLIQRPRLAAAVTIAFGLTRTVWIHAVIAEIYAFGLVILLALLALALWRQDQTRPTTATPARIYWMALLGGVGIAHHRAFVMAIPALVLAVWPQFRANRRALPQVIAVSLALGLLGFLPYVYLPLREASEPIWTYGDPSTLSGFLDQFLGREANRFIGLPSAWDGLWANFAVINTVLLTDLTLPGVIAGIVGLIAGTRRPTTRRAAQTLGLSAGAAYAFHVAFYTDVLSALILPVTLALACGWAFLICVLTAPSTQQQGAWRLRQNRLASALVVILAATLSGVLIQQNRPFISTQTTDRTGLETIVTVGAAPPGSTVMLAWGPRYFAAAFEKWVREGFSSLALVDDKADFAALNRQGARLITADYTFYNQPVPWWEERLGSAVYLRAAAPGLVEIATSPQMADRPLDRQIALLDDTLICDPARFILDVTWAAAAAPARALSVFVHLVDADGVLIAQGDQAAPVYGWRPMTTWLPGEAVRDIYTLPRLPGAANIRFGLYYQAADGAFVNAVTFVRAAMCPPTAEAG